MRVCKVTVDRCNTIRWCDKDGLLHREGAPAIKHSNGTNFWYLNDLLHREDGPAIEGPNGYVEWYLNGLHHREDGPAIIHSDNSSSWWFNGKLHREDGPAVTHCGVTKWEGWYLNGELLTEGFVMARCKTRIKLAPKGIKI